MPGTFHLVPLTGAALVFLLEVVAFDSANKIYYQRVNVIPSINNTNLTIFSTHQVKPQTDISLALFIICIKLSNQNDIYTTRADCNHGLIISCASCILRVDCSLTSTRPKTDTQSIFEHGGGSLVHDEPFTTDFNHGMCPQNAYT